MAKKQSKKTAKSNPWIVWVLVLGAALIISLLANAVLATVLILQPSGQNQQAPMAPPTQQQGSQAGAPEFDFSNAHVLGDADAPVVMVEYASYTCGFCGRFHTDTLPSIKQNFVDSEDVAFVYKHFLRNADDLRIANHAECAGEQGAFFEYSDLVYANQQSMSNQALAGHAETLELDMNEFSACVDESRYADKINADSQEGRSNGVTGTPSFFVNGEKIVGALPYTEFASAINQQLQ